MHPLLKQLVAGLTCVTSILVFGVWYLVFGIWYLVFGIWYLVFGIWYLVFGIWYLVFGIWCCCEPDVQVGGSYIQPGTMNWLLCGAIVASAALLIGAREQRNRLKIDIDDGDKVTEGA